MRRTPAGPVCEAYTEDASLEDISDDIFRRADEIQARAPSTVLSKFPTLASDIYLLA